MPARAIDHITIRGFKSFALIDKLALQPINIVIGANGSGKSNFIGAFSFLHAIREGRLDNYVRSAGGAEKVLHFGSKTTSSMHLDLSFEEGKNRYSLRLSPSADDALFPSEERVHYLLKRKPPKPYQAALVSWKNGREAGIGNPLESGGIAKSVRDRLSRLRLYHLHDTSSSSLMRKISKLHDNRILNPDASNLGAFLYLLQEKYDGEYSLIRRTIQLAAPFFDDFRLAPLELQPEDIKLEWRHKESDQYFDASSLSDGTLRFIALATLLLQPDKFLPSVILVDEPELGLHPYAITLLASMIKQVSVTTQVIVATQSPQLLDHFQPEDVLVADRIDGATTLKRLESKPLKKWLKDYSLGQLWEKNELGGRPGPG